MASTIDDARNLLDSITELTNEIASTADTTPAETIPTTDIWASVTQAQLDELVAGLEERRAALEQLRDHLHGQVAPVAEPEPPL